MRPHGDSIVDFSDAIIAQNVAMSPDEEEEHIKWLQGVSEKITGPGGP